MHCSIPSRVTRMPSSFISPLRTAISRVFSAVLASPPAKAGDGLELLFCDLHVLSPKASGICQGILEEAEQIPLLQRLQHKDTTSGQERGIDLKGRIFRGSPNEDDAALSLHRAGRRPCWALLNLWISSTKSRVLLPALRLISAASITERISLIPLVTALKLINSALVRPAMILARVVFPTPGGPQKIMEEI